MVADAVLGVSRPRVDAVQSPRVGLVLTEEQGWLGAGGVRAADELQLAQKRVIDLHRGALTAFKPRLRRPYVPRPCVAKPRGGKNVQRVGLRTLVGNPHVHQHVQRRVLGVVDLDDPVPIVVKSARVQELVLWIELSPAAILVEQFLVRKGALRIVVPPSVPGMTRERVAVPPVLLRVLAVVRLSARQPEDALLQYRIPTIPERQAKAQALFDIAESCEAVFAPAVCPRAGVIVGKVVPSLAVGTVVLTDGAPLAFAEVRPPDIPVASLPQPVFQFSEAVDALPLDAHHSTPDSSIHRF